MKNEMYYGRTWLYPQELKEAIATYIEFYDNHRSKISLDGLSIAEIPKSHCSVKSKLSNKKSESPYEILVVLNLVACPSHEVSYPKISERHSELELNVNKLRVH